MAAGNTTACSTPYRRDRQGYINFFPIFSLAHGFIIVDSLSQREPAKDLRHFVRVTILVRSEHRDLKAACGRGHGLAGSFRTSCGYFPPEALHHELDELLQFDLA